MLPKGKESVFFTISNEIQIIENYWVRISCSGIEVSSIYSDFWCRYNLAINRTKTRSYNI